MWGPTGELKLTLETCKGESGFARVKKSNTNDQGGGTPVDGPDAWQGARVYRVVPDRKICSVPLRGLHDRVAC